MNQNDAVHIEVARRVQANANEMRGQVTGFLSVDEQELLSGTSNLAASHRGHSHFSTSSPTIRIMSNHNTPAPARSGLSLYANLLDPSSSSASGATISRAPVAFQQESPAPGEDASAKKQQINAGRYLNTL
jgi:hypothetical protein